MDSFKRLYKLWISNENPQQGSFAKFFLGKASPAFAGVMAGFFPTAMMVMHRVLFTAERPRDLADAVLTCKVGDHLSLTIGPPVQRVRKVCSHRKLWSF